VETTIVEARAKSSDSLSKGSTKMSHLLRQESKIETIKQVIFVSGGKFWREDSCLCCGWEWSYEFWFFLFLLSAIVISRNEYQRACNITLGQLQRMGR
jgi:hypothetical protein